VVKDQLQRLPLPPWQSGQRPTDCRLKLQAEDILVGILALRSIARSSQMPGQHQRLKQAPAAALRHSFSNYGKEPRFECRSSVEPRLSFQDLQVHGLKNVFRFFRIS
jgi:hypothetical protein